jgi:hypothetical protein
MTDRDTIALLVHGEPGAGKSWLGQTAPAPRLVLDAEGGSRSPKRIVDGKVQRIPQITWDPHQGPPPVEGEWETCRVKVRDFTTLQRVFEYLNTGEHPFRSVIVDSLTEVQKRCKDSIRDGDEVMNERMWGILLDRMELLIRAYRDLVDHPIKPIDALVILALSVERNFKFKPAVQGALGTSLPGYVDTEGFLAPTMNEAGEEIRRLLIHPHERFEAKDRTHTLTAHYGHTIDNPSVSEMLAVLNEEEQ